MATPARPRRTRVARPTRRGLIFAIGGVVAGGAAYANGRTELLWLGAFLVAMPLAAWLYVRFRPLSFASHREFSPNIVAAGTATAVSVQLQNTAKYASPAGHWRDSWPWRPFASAPVEVGPLAGTEAGRVQPKAFARLKYVARPSRRGFFEVGPLLFDYTDPFGLADGAIVAQGHDTLVVTPELVELPEGAVSIAADEGPTRLRQRRSFGGEDDLMTREYRQGDAMRRVHWRASAHHGELMVRQEEQRSHAEARIVLETVRSAYRDARSSAVLDEIDSETFEWTVAFAGSLALYLAERGFIVQVDETGDRQLAPLDQPDEFLESLAAVQLVDQHSDRSRLLSSGARGRSQGSAFAILSHSGNATVHRLAEQRRRFDLAVAFLVDPWPSPHVDALLAAGWLCVQVHPSESMDDVWLRVGAEQDVLRDQA
ncbi:MAG: hypothetical protein JWN36_797 [Microbacteriaceae bacterium]|nr:hypothetical protein [Microbacteriaceae bacterium]